MKESVPGIEVRRRLMAVTDDEWEAIYRRLAAHTANRVRVWRGLPGGNTVEQVVNDAVDSLWTGRRAWNPATQPDLLIHLKLVANSLLSHLFEAADWRRVARIEALAAVEPAWWTHAPSAPSPEDEIAIQQTWDRLAARVATDAELSELLATFEHEMTREERAAHLGITVGEVDARLKRLRRRLKRDRSVMASASSKAKVKR